MTGRGPLREARAGVFTLVCLSLSVALHSWASGSIPAPTAIAAGAGLVLVAAVVLSGRERGYPVIAATLLAAQGGLHVLFEAVPHHAHHMSGPMPGPATGTMIAAHLTAGLLTAAWLRGGEAAAWRICRWLARTAGPLRVLRTLVRLLVTPVPGTTSDVPVDVERVAVPAQVCAGSVVRRGPPVRSV